MITKDQDASFSLKGVSLLSKQDSLLVSFIGTHLDQKAGLADLLKIDLGDSCFEFLDQTAVSITFKITGHTEDKNTYLKKAHDVLLKINHG